MTTTKTEQNATALTSNTDSPGIDQSKSERDQSDITALLAKARYDAFRMVTDASAEAGTILDEARAESAEIVREAELTAESLVDAARLRAVEISDNASDAPTVQDASEIQALESEHDELSQQVSSLRSLADQLEERFATLAANAATSQQEIAPGAVPKAKAAGPVIDYSPSVPPPSEAKTEVEVADEDADKGSFYSRRSANLPSIGAAGGQSALDMMRNIRGNLGSYDD